MFLVLFCSFIAYSSSQVHNYYIYPSNSSSAPYTFSYQQVNGEYDASPSKFTREVSPAIQAQANQGSSLLSDPGLKTYNQTTQNNMRSDATAQYASGFGNSTVSILSQSTTFPNTSQPFNQNDVGIANNTNGVICPFNDRSAGLCNAGRCPSGFVCNVDNVCCPCSVGAAQGSCTAGACSSPSLRCEAASGMCCPRPPLTNSSGVNETVRKLAMDTARNGSMQLVTTQGPIYASNATQSSASLVSMGNPQSTTTSTAYPING